MKIIALLFCVCSATAFGQCTNCEQPEGQEKICWGDDRSANEVHYAKFVDYAKQVQAGNSKWAIEEALVEMNWLLENAPCLSNCQYIRYEKLLNKIIADETSKTIKKRYSKKRIEVKRLKRKHFPNDDPSTIHCQ